MHAVSAGRREQLRAEVVVGSDGFLFHRFEMAFEQLCSDSVPSDRQLARWLSLLETRAAWCASKGITYVTLVVPERHVIYSDKLPPDSRISPARPIKRLQSAISSNGRPPALYPEDQLRAARREGEVFLRTDEHLNDFGTYVCYLALLDGLSEAVPLVPWPRDSLTSVPRELCGNLGVRLDEEPVELTEMLRLADSTSVRRVFRNPPGHSPVEVFRHHDGDLPKAVVFGDSNVTPLCRYLLPHFSRSVVLRDTQRLFHDLIRSERPDVVVNVMSEARLGNLGLDGTVVLPIDADIVDFLGHCGEAIPDGTDRTVLAIDFILGGDGATFARTGWSYPEANHTWMVDDTSILELPPFHSRRANQRYVLEFDLWPIEAGEHRSQELRIGVHAGRTWHELARVEVRNRMRLRVPLHGELLAADQPVVLRLDHPRGVAPPGADKRILSLAVTTLSVMLVEQQ